MEVEEVKEDGDEISVCIVIIYIEYFIHLYWFISSLSCAVDCLLIKLIMCIMHFKGGDRI